MNVDTIRAGDKTIKILAERDPARLPGLTALGDDE